MLQCVITGPTHFYDFLSAQWVRLASELIVLTMFQNSVKINLFGKFSERIQIPTYAFDFKTEKKSVLFSMIEIKQLQLQTVCATSM